MGGFAGVIGGHEVARRGHIECVLGLGPQDEAGVRDLIERAQKAGAEIVTEPGQQPWGYAGAFADPDGHSGWSRPRGDDSGRRAAQVDQALDIAVAYPLGRTLALVPCLIALFALIGPRVALVFTWLSSNMISRAIDSTIVAILGFLFLPWTTLAYVVFYEVGAGREVAGLEWFLVGLAFIADIGSVVGGRRARE